MAAPGADEARELALIDKVEFRIALADTDAKLQAVLQTYLAPLLLKLASEHASARKKVTSICQSINVRVQPQTIALPVHALIKQFKQHASSPFVRHFDLLYIQRGIGRLSEADKAVLFGELLPGFAENNNASVTQGASLLNLLLRTLVLYTFPPHGSPEDKQLRASLAISDGDAKALSYWFQKLLLLPSNVNNLQNNAPVPSFSPRDLAYITLQGKEGVWNSSFEGGLAITETKQAALKALRSGLFTDKERLIPTLIATADTNAKISEAADDILKKIVANVPLEDENTVAELYDLYFGSVDSALPQDERKIGATIPLRIKILGLLQRSKCSTKYPTKIIRLAEHNLVGQQASDRQGPGREVSRLTSATVAFLSFVAQNARPHDLTEISRGVLEALKEFLEQHSNAFAWDLATIRGKSFEVVGLLTNSNHELLLEPSLALLNWLFRALAEEPNRDVLFSIEGAVSSMLRPYQQHADTRSHEVLRDLLLRNLAMQEGNAKNVRIATVRFANQCLPFNDVVARWIDIIALAEASDETHEIAEEAQRGLNPHWYRLMSTSGLPSALSSAQTQLLDERCNFPEISKLVRFTLIDHMKETHSSRVLPVVLSFCRQALILESQKANNIATSIDMDWDRKLDLAISEDVETRSAVRNHLSSLSDTHPNFDLIIHLWQAALLGLMTSQQKDRHVFARFALELCTMSPEAAIVNMGSELRDLEKATAFNDMVTRSSSSRCYALLASGIDARDKTLIDSINALSETAMQWKSAVGSGVNRSHGAVIALAFLLARRAFRRGSDGITVQVSKILLPLIFEILNHAHDALVLEAAYQALEQLCLFQVVSVANIEEHMPLTAIIEHLTRKAQTGNMRAIAALGAVAMTLDEQKRAGSLDTLFEQIRGLQEIRQAETQFAVGEALCCLACGWQCKTLISTFDLAGDPPTGPERSQTTTSVLDQILEDSTSTKPSTKKASVIWLLCFLQFCSDHSEIKKRLPRFQLAFKRCLSDRDELVQESASRGLGLVYEKGDHDLKNDLVRDLISSFANDRSSMSGTVSEETQLFEPGALPTGDGSITTYKDIMSLASEVGDSSLVYRFMSLASNNAIWSSRAAFGRFGLSNVLSDSSTHGYLAENPKLYPKLYRYRFDANTNVRKAMNEIWNSLVKDTATTVNKHFDAIMSDLLINIIGREWRTRQASCAAIADLIQGRRLEKIQPYMDQCWSLCFKVLDDIKASVRTAAAELARVLTSILIRNLETETSDTKVSDITHMLRSVLPFILSTSGLESGTDEVRLTSLSTLLEIVKKAREQILRPFIPELVERLLGMLSTFEPEVVNYVHMNAAQYSTTQEEIDDLRLRGIRAGPLMEAIERCLDQADEDTLKQTVPRIQAAIKSAIGLPTKVGCSRILVSLSTRRAFLFRPFADQFLDTIYKRIVDRSATVSSSYATAIGYLARGSSDTAILRVVGSSKDAYFNAEDERPRLIMGDVFHAIAKHATDHFNNLASSILPLIFVAMHDSDETVRKVFKETWDDATSSRAALLYLTEIIELASQHLESRRWGTKHAAMLSVAECVQLVTKAQQGSISEEQARLIWPALKASVAGRHWQGKEQVLDAYDLFKEKAIISEEVKLEVEGLGEKVERARKKAKEDKESET